jgi:hypothetical protein
MDGLPDRLKVPDGPEKLLLPPDMLLWPASSLSSYRRSANPPSLLIPLNISPTFLPPLPPRDRIQHVDIAVEAVIQRSNHGFSELGERVERMTSTAPTGATCV